MRLKIPHQMHILVCVCSAINTQLTIFKINFSYISAFSILCSAFPHFSAGCFFLATAKLTENKTRMEILCSSLHAALHFQLPLRFCVRKMRLIYGLVLVRGLEPGDSSLRNACVRKIGDPQLRCNPGPCIFLQLAPMQMHWLHSKDGGILGQSTDLFWHFQWIR